MNKKWLTWLLLLSLGLLMLVSGVYLSFKREQDQMTTSVEQKNAVDKLLNTSFNETFKGPNTLKDLMKRKETQFTLINFWGTWCPPCREEMPDLQQLQAEFNNSKRLQLFGLSFDRSESVQKYLNEIKSNYPNLEADIGKIDLIFALGAEKAALPFSILLNSKGEIIYKESGKLNLEQVRLRLNHHSESIN